MHVITFLRAICHLPAKTVRRTTAATANNNITTLYKHDLIGDKDMNIYLLTKQKILKILKIL